MKNIIIFGAPGSGKGTYSDEIVKKFGMSHISTGDVLRSEIKNDTELGKIAKSYIDKGQLIPDELMIDILAKVYDSIKDNRGVIFDGFPRTIAQAEALKKMLELPVTKYTPAAYGQLSTFLSKLNQDEAKMFKEYLGKNEAVKRAIDRGEELIKTLNNKK